MISKLYEQRLKKDLSRLAILTLITVIVWIAIAVYRALNKSQLTPDVKKQILPLTTSIDLDTMNLIKNRMTVTEASWSSLGVIPPEISQVPASPTPLEETATATESSQSALTQPETTASGSAAL